MSLFYITCQNSIFRIKKHHTRKKINPIFIIYILTKKEEEKRERERERERINE